MSYNSDGQLKFQLPPGPENDNYEIRLYINLRDNSEGVKRFNISQPVQVNPDKKATDALVLQILTKDENSNFLKSMATGSLQDSSKNVIVVGELLNQRITSNQTNDNV